MSLFQAKCSSCEKPIDRHARYCPHCGAAQGRQTIECANCRREMAANARFCPHCGQPAATVAAPPLRDNRWSRLPEEIAVRIEADDLEGMTRRLIVEPGTEAIILDNGRSLGVQGPNSYTLESIGDRLRQFFTSQPANRRVAILIDTAPFDLEFSVSGVFTQDPLRVGLRVRLTLQVDSSSNPPIMQFYTNLMRSRHRFSRADLHAYLLPEVEDAAQAWLSSHTVSELAENLDLKAELETHIYLYLERTLAQNGLAYLQLRTMDYALEHVDQVRGIEEKYLIRATEMDAELSGRKKVFDVFQAEQLQEIAEEVQKVEQFERKNKIRARMRQAILSDKFDEIRSEQEMEQFLRQIDKENLIADDEWARIKRTIQWRQDDELRQRKDALQDSDWARAIVLEDRDRNRAHLLARLDLENKFELAQLDLLQRLDLEPEQLAFEQAMARQRMEGEMALEAKRQEFELSQQAQRAQFRRGEQELEDSARQRRENEDARARAEVAMIQAQSEAERARLRLEIERLEDEQDLLLAREAQAMMRENQLQKELNRLAIKEKEMEIDLRLAQQQLELELRRKQVEHEQEMARRAQDQQFELNWMEALKGMAPAELAVTARDTERAQIIRDMQDTEAMRGMTEQQILAMMAKNSPQAAAALAEIAKAAAAGQMDAEQREMYERLLQQSQQMAQWSKAEADRLDAIRREQGERDKEMMFKALDSQREAGVEIARATSHPPVSPGGPTVVVPGTGYTTIGAGGQPGGSTLRCPKCNEIVTEDANFCPNCQHKLRGG